MMKTARTINQNVKNTPIHGDIYKIIKNNTPILTIGSCFALEVNRFLINRKYNILNKEFGENMIWYNTYTILYEFQRLNNKFIQDFDDIWGINNKWQDPYRRCIFGKSKQELWDQINNINNKMRSYIISAKIIVITLGLTEVWFAPNDRAICASPGYPRGKGGGQDCIFRATNYDENLKNMNEILSILSILNKDCKVILTVSPVPLGMTFREMDHIVANTDSKSILRAVAGEIVKNNKNTYYFHSYELAMNVARDKVFKADGRHVNPDFVAWIMNNFSKHFVI